MSLEHLDDAQAQALALESPTREEAAHLETCERCLALVGDYARLARALDRLPLPPAPALSGAVLQRIAERREGRALWAIATGLLVLMGWISLLGLRLCYPHPFELARPLADSAALLRVASALGPALRPLQALLAVVCAAVAFPAWLAGRALLTSKGNPS